MFTRWIAKVVAENPDILNDDWLDFTRADFNHYRMHDKLEFDTYYANFQRGLVTPTGPTNTSTSFLSTSSGSTSSYSRRTPADEFRKGIRRDLTAYPIFKDERYWEKFRRQLITVARAQGVARVLDPDFVPAAPEDVELFKEQQMFMYAVFLLVYRQSRVNSSSRSTSKTEMRNKFFSKL